jgi:anaerobic selenocysteine-containing dehydrogenase
MGAHRIIVCWCMGLTQHKNAVAGIQEVINFLLLRGNIGRPGAGPCPVRGHSNVQGDRTMGIWDKPKEEFLDKLGREFAFEPPARAWLRHGRGHKGHARGPRPCPLRHGRKRPLGSLRHPVHPGGLLRKCSLTAHVSIKLNRSHLVTGRTALILPCLGRTEIDRQASGEQFMTVEDSMGVIGSTRGNLEPVSPDLLSEPAIVAGLAKAVLGPGKPIDWDDYVANYDLIRDKIEAVIPGFPAFNDRIRVGTFYLPNPPRDERKFPTPSKKAVFIPHKLSRARPSRAST